MVTEEMVKVAETYVETRIQEFLPDVIKEVKQQILEQKKKSLLNAGENDWDQTPFPELQPSTIRRKKKYSKPDHPLFRTGDLEKSLYVNDNPNDLDVHSDLSYVSHLKTWEDSKGNPHPFDELTDQEYDAVLTEIEKRLQDAFS